MTESISKGEGEGWGRAGKERGEGGEERKGCEERKVGSEIIYNQDKQHYATFILL